MPVETKKEQILRVAETVFAQRGFKGATVREIAERVGIKTPGLYYHFQSKEDIFDSLILDRYQELGSTILEPIKEAQGLKEKLRMLVVLLVDFWAEHPLMPLIVAQETMARSDLIYKELIPNFLVPMFSEMVQPLEDEAEHSGLKDVDLPLLVYNIFGLTMFYFFSGQIYTTLTERECFSEEQLDHFKSEVLQMVFHGVQR